jgi:hypothetical protein
MRKIERLWEQETSSLSPNANFAFKTRTDRFNALFSGLGFMMNYGMSIPSYRNCFETFELEDAVFQPTGGAQWETHLYAGRQNIVRSESDLLKGDYDKEQVQKLLRRAAKTDRMPYEMDETTTKALAKFSAMGVDVKDADYTGETLFKLVELRLTMKGENYYLLFSPAYGCWLAFDRFKERFSADIDPWTKWQTHEDNKNFLTKSYADDCYGVADAVHTLFNQELTNREKRNLNARAYDPSMFTDVAKLDQAQYRPDALVPFDSKGGIRKVSDGLFTFETAALGGTIDITEWVLQQTGKATGVTDVRMGSSDDVSKKVGVMMAEEQNVSKRLLLRTSPYTEAMGKIARLFIQGAKDHMPQKIALKRLGTEGEDWDAVIEKTDLDLWGDFDIKITSSRIEMRNSTLKKEARMKTLDSISVDPNQAAQLNPKWLVKEKLKAGGEYDEPEIKLAMDTKNYGNDVEVGRAHEAIEMVQINKKPQPFYGATTLFMKIIHDFAVNNRVSLGDRKFQTLIDYEMAHAPIAEENMMRLAAQAPTGPVDPNAPVPAGVVQPTV